jgi:hypothetical protein
MRYICYFVHYRCRLIRLQSDVLHLINTKIRWSSLNRRNLNLLMIMTVMTKKPFSLKFSNNVILNYALGVKVSVVLSIHMFD